MVQSENIKSVTLGGLFFGGGELKSWKILRVEGKIIRSPRYVIDVIGTDPLYLGKLGGGLILKN